MNKSIDQVTYVLPKVVIIVLNWNGRDLTADCLDSLQRVVYQNFEVILVDNASTDGSQQFFKERYPNVAVLENKENLGFAGGNNIGIQEALRRNSDYVLLLNNDTVVDIDFLSALVKAGESDRKIGMLNPKIYYYDRPNVLWYAGGELSLFSGMSKHYGFRQVDHGQFDCPRDVDFLTGCAFFIKREVIEKIGLLDEIFFCYSEDADWTIRARKAGYRGYYEPAAKVWHKIGASASGDISLYWGTRNAMYLVYKHTAQVQFIIFICRFFVVWVLLQTVKLIISRDIKSLNAIYRGFMDFWPLRKSKTA